MGGWAGERRVGEGGGWVVGREAGEGGQPWEAEGRPKQPFGPKQQCCAPSMGHRLVESTREAKTAVRSSLVPHAVILMPSRAMKCILVV